MTTTSNYKLVEAPDQSAGGVLIDTDNGTPQQHVDYLLKKYGDRLVTVFQDGQQLFPEVHLLAEKTSGESHALLQA